jgi:hypothetical protein
MFKITAVFSLVACLVGCTGVYNRRMTQMMQPYLDRPVTAVVEAWGPPTTVYDEAPYKVYVWHSSRTSGGGTYSQQIPTGGRDAAGNIQTKTVVHGGNVYTSNTYRMFWVGADGNCVKYKFGTER